MFNLGRKLSIMGRIQKLDCWREDDTHATVRSVVIKVGYGSQSSAFHL
jgi:hypothetical protein